MWLLERSKFYAIRHNADERIFYIDFGQKLVKLNFCQLLALRHRINEISILSHFDGDLNKHGFEILTLCNNEHLFILDTLQLIDLKTLIQNAFVAMGLSKNAVGVGL